MNDFIMTIDDEEIVEGEVSEDEFSDDQKKKSKKKDTISNDDGRVKKNKVSQKNNKRNNGTQENEVDLMNPSFTFYDALASHNHTEHEWDFKAARAGLKEKTSVPSKTIDEIIESKRKDINKSERSVVEKPEKEDEDKENNDEERTNKDLTSEDEDKILMDEDDEDLDVDGFGAGSREFFDDNNNISEDETEQEEINSEEDRKEQNNSDDDHTSSDDEEETEFEKQRKKEYFADESEIVQSEVVESFQTMNLSRPILKGLSKLGFIQPTMIQMKTIPIALMGKDICGGAITGSGKTIAFLVPIMERLLYRPRKTPSVRVLILVPTRELALQCHSVSTRLAVFTDVTSCLCIGGLSLKKQEVELRTRPDIIIATPGRLIDHVHNSPSFTLDTIEILIIDEADRMLEDGFSDELNEIVKCCPKSRQTMLFSATMTDDIDDLIRLSLNRPVRLMVDSTKATAAKLIQEFIRIRGHREEDRTAMLLVLCKQIYHHRVIIFFRSKAMAHNMKITFGLLGLKAAELHGSLSQEQRLEALETFRDGKVDFLLATDLASRGLDIKGIDTVINYDMPQSYNHYIHRVGRTARAGRNGRSVTLTGESDRKILKLVIKNTPREQVKRRTLDVKMVAEIRAKLDKLKDQVKEVLEEEKEAKIMRQAEMELQKNENLLIHEKEIYSRPARTWFQTEQKKQQSKN
ncbi:17977_t:CDS:2, partial [Acaulospora morrowiae]